MTTPLIENTKYVWRIKDAYPGTVWKTGTCIRYFEGIMFLRWHTNVQPYEGLDIIKVEEYDVVPLPAGNND